MQLRERAVALVCVDCGSLYQLNAYASVHKGGNVRKGREGRTSFVLITQSYTVVPVSGSPLYHRSANTHRHTRPHSADRPHSSTR